MGEAVTNDLIVVLPGIMGSTLVKDGREVWSASAGAIVRAICSFGKSVRALTLPPGLGDDDPRDGVTAGRLMPDLHVIPGLWSVSLGYDRLLARLRAILRPPDDGSRGERNPPNLLPVPYDWRLSNRLNGRRLKRVIEPALERLRALGGRFADARVTFICHSMGGLVARWYVEQEGGREIARRIITLGTPHRGALKALRDLSGGVRKELGPLGLDLTAFARSLPSAYELLPSYACVSAGNGLVKLTETAVPGLDAELLAGAAAFHAAMESGTAGDAERATLVPVVGIKQATHTTATIADGILMPLDTIDGVDERGDGTVPRLAATPAWLPPDDPAVHWVAARHGALQRNDAVLDHLEGILTAQPIVHRGAGLLQVGVRIPELVFAGERASIEAWLDGEERPPLMVEVRDERGRRVDRAMLTPCGGAYRGDIGSLPPGGYVATVRGYGAAVAHVQAVEAPFLVWEPAHA
mgnify:CR=1 FL=1